MKKYLMLSLFILMVCFTGSKEKVRAEEGKITIIGDSRTVGMYNATYHTTLNEINCTQDNVQWLAKTGAGYNFLVSSFNNISPDTQKIIITIGVNDCKSFSQLQKYVTLLNGNSNRDIVYVSVLPVSDKSKKIKKEDVFVWNEIMKRSLVNISYLDLSSFEYNVIKYQPDGLHFTSDTYATLARDLLSLCR